MRARSRLICGIATVVVTAAISRALVLTDSHGRWPADWPKALEALRDHAKTIQVASGTQENIYEITFTDRAAFEKAWPDLLALKTYGAPLRLFKVGPLPAPGLGQLESNALPTVRIYAPSDGEVSIPDGGPAHKASAPWPTELYGLKGELPEFVSLEGGNGKSRWVVVHSKYEGTSFHYRARIDIDLVVDGQVIDLNRIPLSKDGPIEDRRF